MYKRQTTTRAKEEKSEKEPISIEQKFIAYILNFPSKVRSILCDIEFEDSSLSTIYKSICSCYNHPSTRSECLEKARSNLSRDEKERLGAVVITWDQQFAEDEDVAEKEFEEIKTHLESKAREKIKNDFAKQIAQAETSGDIEKVRKLMKSLQESLK